MRPRSVKVSPYRVGAGGGGSVIGFASLVLLRTLTDFLGSFLGAFFTCFFFPAMVRMPPVWDFHFKLMLDWRFRVCGIARWRRKTACRSDFSCDPLSLVQTLC